MWVMILVARHARIPSTNSDEQRIEHPEILPVYQQVYGTKRSSTGAELVEVAPGVIAQFEGTTDATWEAILDGHVNVIACTCCGVDLHCMDVVHLVVCPQCKVVSPTTAAENEVVNHHHQSKRTVVGVGFTSETIVEWMEQR